MHLSCWLRPLDRGGVEPPRASLSSRCVSGKVPPYDRFRDAQHGRDYPAAESAAAGADAPVRAAYRDSVLRYRGFDRVLLAVWRCGGTPVAAASPRSARAV